MSSDPKIPCSSSTSTQHQTGKLTADIISQQSHSDAQKIPFLSTSLYNEKTPIIPKSSHIEDLADKSFHPSTRSTPTKSVHFANTSTISPSNPPPSPHIHYTPDHHLPPHTTYPTAIPPHLQQHPNASLYHTHHNSPQAYSNQYRQGQLERTVEDTKNHRIADKD
ncbi:hypothetical protein PCASD_24561 [Puccinia coronata f. sp. avenae]|uniref:Uncharacterized protein n=1 Tax=Puccinia coronata f. sp. avenae TaxID=200324 RepID=A0A2N5SQI8_9BASI|nr:hypothetical protein PCASD_24561 [Puccinia coronata f. sp. avenae]